MTRKTFFGNTFATLVAIVCLAGCSDNKTAPAPILKVAAILPETGPGAVFADYIKKGLDLAADEINSQDAGAIRLIYGDSKNNPTEGVSVFRQFALTEKPPVAIVALSSVTKAVGPLARENNTVVIGTAVALPNVTDPSAFLFRVYPEATGLAGVIAKYAGQRFKTAAVVYINDDFGLSGSEAFKKVFESAGGKVLLTEPYNLTEKDFRTQWEKIRAAKPECVWVTGYGPAYSTIVRQMREANVESVLLADMTLGLPITVKNVGNAADGVVYVDGPIDAGFAERFRKKYGEGPTSYAGYAYDIVKMLDRVRKTEGTSPEQIRDGFSKIKDFPGAMGSITIQSNRDAALKFTLMQVKNGVPVPYER